MAEHAAEPVWQRPKAVIGRADRGRMHANEDFVVFWHGPVDVLDCDYATGLANGCLHVASTGVGALPELRPNKDA
jgi:hypothetical protein